MQSEGKTFGDKMNNKHAFWQALILTLIVFNIGIYFGYSLEKNRVEKIDQLYISSELELLDIRAQNDIYTFNNINCDNLIKENILFADRIYEEAKLLDDYEGASRISDALILRHKKYDILRTQLWINSIKLKEKCKISYHNVVYFYKYSNNNPPIETKAKQSTFSRKLGDLKNEKGERILLIPISGDADFGAIRILMNNYNITEQELPVVLIDEKIKITEIEDLENIELYID